MIKDNYYSNIPLTEYYQEFKEWMEHMRHISGTYPEPESQDLWYLHHPRCESDCDSSG